MAWSRALNWAWMRGPSWELLSPRLQHEKNRVARGDTRTCRLDDCTACACLGTLWLWLSCASIGIFDTPVSYWFLVQTKGSRASGPGTTLSTETPCFIARCRRTRSQRFPLRSRESQGYRLQDHRHQQTRYRTCCFPRPAKDSLGNSSPGSRTPLQSPWPYHSWMTWQLCRGGAIVTSKQNIVNPRRKVNWGKDLNRICDWDSIWRLARKWPTEKKNKASHWRERLGSRCKSICWW